MQLAVYLLWTAQLPPRLDIKIVITCIFEIKIINILFLAPYLVFYMYISQLMYFSILRNLN